MAAEYDIIIIGGGPSGLSAASSIVRQSHETVLLDSGKYRNGKSKHMHTVPAWDNHDPEEFRAAARADFVRYDSVTVENVEVTSVKKRDDGLFEATGNNGKAWVGKKLILATGVQDVFPDIPGYADCWLSGIFHCLYCHGWEEKGTPSAGMLAEGDTSTAVVALHLARQALRMSDRVTLYTNGNEQLAKDLADALEAAPAPMAVEPRKITKLVKAPERAQITIHLDDGTSKTEAFLAHKPKTTLRGSLAQQLGLELTPMNTIKVNPPFNQTSVKGVFAAGDCSSPMHTVNAALHSGTCAGGGAPLQIQAETYNQRAIF
ncbi:FAD/NAD(P)-binding domain-containing protein [Camillea tinctor]|nr:FAD/NAD(P)-binding domain-containing protein [Camillea tinctor]